MSSSHELAKMSSAELDQGADKTETRQKSCESRLSLHCRAASELGSLTISQF